VSISLCDINDFGGKLSIVCLVPIGTEPKCCHLRFWICSWCYQSGFGSVSSFHWILRKCYRTKTLLWFHLTDNYFLFYTVASLSGVEVLTGSWTVLNHRIWTSVWASRYTYILNSWSCQIIVLQTKP